jgi:hypothetical protein
MNRCGLTRKKRIEGRIKIKKRKDSIEELRPIWIESGKQLKQLDTVFRKENKWSGETDGSGPSYPIHFSVSSFSPERSAAPPGLLYRSKSRRNSFATHKTRPQQHLRYTLFSSHLLFICVLIRQILYCYMASPTRLYHRPSSSVIAVTSAKK